jgi:hypothetical protein
MRKIFSLVLASSLISGVFLATSSSAAPTPPKVGTVCTKSGAFFDTPNVRYVCNVEGRKKVWRVWNNPGASNSSASKTQNPMSSTANAAPFVPKIPITLPVVQNGSITFANAVANISSIPQVAWQRVQDVIAANTDVNIPTTITIGPNTHTTKEQIVPLLQKAYRLFQGFSQPSSYIGLAYNGQDEPWAESQIPTVFSSQHDPQVLSHIAQIMKNACDLSNAANANCSGGNSLDFSPSTAGSSLYGVQEPYWNSANQNVGPMSQVDHEYTHNVQFAQWIGAPLPAGVQSRAQAAHAKMPCWFQEGQANAIGIPVWAPDLQSYISARRGNVARAINANGPKVSLTSFTADAFSNFLYGQDPLTCFNPASGDYQLGYSVGYAASEALIAIGGPQATMALLTKMAAGDNWSEAFQHVYGISWKDGSKTLGAVLSAEYAILPLGSTG